jgi:filamentous hemagglutinin
MSTLYKKLYPDSVEKINDRYPINADFAGQKFPLDKLPEHIREKYPDSVMFDEQGFARFEPYTYVDETGKLYRVELDIITGGEKDIDYANKAMGVTDTPEGHMWHHIEHTKIVIAVPKDIHEAVRHIGGRATNKAGSKK